MKSAAQWIQSKTRLVKHKVCTQRFTEADIKAIQLDALESAARAVESGKLGSSGVTKIKQIYRSGSKNQRHTIRAWMHRVLTNEDGTP